MKSNITLTHELKEGGDKGGNVWGSGGEKARFLRGKMPRLRP